MLSRRGFFARVFAGTIAARFASILPQRVIKGRMNTTPVVGAINQTTCEFWRNQQAYGTSASFDSFSASLRSVYNQCASGVRDES